MQNVDWFSGPLSLFLPKVPDTPVIWVSCSFQGPGLALVTHPSAVYTLFLKDTRTHQNIIQPVKKNEITPFAATRMDLQIIKLSEVSQRETNIIRCPLYVKFKIMIQMNLFVK